MSRREKYPERNAEIRRLYATGNWSIRALARHVGLLHGSVLAIINPERANARSRARNARLYGLDEEYTEKMRARSREYSRRKKDAQP